MKQRTINPWINNHLRSLGQLQLGQLSLHTRILQRNLLHGKNLLPITRGVHIRSKSDIVLNRLLAEVCHGLVELVLFMMSVFPTP